MPAGPRMFQPAAMQRGRPAGTLATKDLHVCPLIVEDHARFIQAARHLRAATTRNEETSMSKRLFPLPQCLFGLLGFLVVGFLAPACSPATGAGAPAPLPS